MNYRHAFHAGNFADVFKHAVLVRILLHLAGKEAPFRVIDTHSGIGHYDLSREGSRTHEWRAGIARLIEHPPAGEAGELLAPYLKLVRGLNAGGEFRHYPGSPAIAQAFCRAQDRMIFCELHPEDHATLRKNIGPDARAKTAAIDGWTALKAYLPPKERRGLVLTDPAFEERDEFARLCSGLAEGHRRWATGIYLLWYPIKDREEVHAFERRMAGLQIPKILRAELSVGAGPKAESLHNCGLIVVNPPWRLQEELEILLPALARSLATNGEGKFRLGWIAP